MKLSAVHTLLFACRQHLRTYGDMLDNCGSSANDVDDTILEIAAARKAIEKGEIELDKPTGV